MKKLLQQLGSVCQVVCFVFIFATQTESAFSQCGAPAFKQNVGWCDNYYAQWEINNVPAGTKYHWYYKDGSVTKDAGYGPNGDGSFITTPYRCQSSDGNSVTMWYAKEGGFRLANVAISSFDKSAADGKSDFSVTFKTDVDVKINSFEIPVLLYNVGDKSMSIRFSSSTNTYNVSYNFGAEKLRNISGQVYMLTVQLDLSLPKGTYNVTIPSTSVDGFGWMSSTATYSNQSFGVSVTSGSASFWGSTNYSNIYNWDIEVACDLLESPAANLRTTNCCEPVTGQDVSLSATLEYIESGQSTDLTVTHYNSTNNYFVWYKDGSEVSRGQGKLTYSTSQTGTYSVREIKNAAATFLNEKSCYMEGSLDIQNRMFSVRNNDAAPTHCFGSKIELEAVPRSGAAVAKVDWTPAQLFANPTGTKAVAELNSEGELVFEATALVLEGNVTKNGDFEAGNTGFSSRYTIKTDGSIPDGQNALIDANASTGYVGWVNNFNGTNQSQNAAYWTQDGTPGGKKCTGNGKFMTIDGKSDQSGWVVWEESNLPVSKNKEYDFSMDLANVGWGDLSRNPFSMGEAAPIEVYVNDVLLIRTFPNSEWCSWVTRTAKWNSENNTTAKITIKQFSANTNGNDFAIDNIYMGTPRIQKDTVKVNVTDCYEVVVENNNCVLTARAINSVTGKEVGQVDHWEDASGNIIEYGNTLDASVITTATTTYKAVAYFPSGSVITNGDFELGLSGFKYGRSNGLYDQGNQQGSFTILRGEDILNTACGQWCVRVDDHTSGSGNMLYVDPTSDDGDIIAYDFTAVKDKAYILSLFFANACRFTDRNPLPISAQLSFIVENKATGTREEITTKQLSDNNDWEDLSAVWTAPTNGLFTLYIRAAGDETLTIQDNTNPENSRSGGNDFVIDDISFATSLDKVYEGEIEVRPCVECKEPTPITLTSSRTDGYMCDGETITLSTNNQANTTDFQFDWYKGETLATATPVLNKVARTGIKSDSYAISDIDDAGTYWVRVSDAHYPDMDACWSEASVTITPAVKPTVEITGGAEYCEDATSIEKPVFTFTGTPPYKFRYTVDERGTATTSNWITNYTSDTYSPTTISNAVGNYLYSLFALEDAHCVADDADLSNQKARIIIYPKPTITEFVSSGNACEGSELSISLKLQSKESSSCQYSYTDYKGDEISGWITVTDNFQKIVVSDAATVAHSGTYTFFVSLVPQCSDSKSVDVEIYPNPTIDNIAVSSDKVCSGTDITFTPTVTDTDSGQGTFEWSGTKTGDSEVLTVNEMVSAITEVTETLTYTTSHNCSVTSGEVTATIYPIPDAPATINDSWCKNSTADPVRATIETGNVANWFDASHTALSGAPTPSTANATQEGQPITYYVSQTAYKSGSFAGCTSPESPLQVVINDKLSPNIVASPAAFCKKLSTTLSLDKTYKTQKWMLGTTSLGTGATCTFGSDKSDGKYTIGVEVTDENGCSGTAEKEIIIYPLPTATLTPEEEIKICDKTSATITAIITSGDDGNGPYTAQGSWSDNATKIDDYTATFSANGDGAKTVEYHYISTYGCEFDAPIPSKKINVIAIPSAAADWTVTYCEKATASALEAPSTASGVKWYDALDATTALSGAPTPSTDAQGTYYYYMTQKPDICESEKTKISVVVNPLPEPVITAKVTGVEKDNACFGTAINLNLDATYRSQTWSCSPNDYLSSTTDAAPALKATAPAGTYTIGVLVEDNNKCKNLTEITKTLVVHPIPVSDLSDLTAQCADDNNPQTITATITPNLNGDGTWSDNVENTTDFTATFTPNKAGDGTHTITYNFTSEAGCKAAQVEKTVQVYPMPNITITPSVSSVCEQGGATSGTVTVSMGGTYSTTGTETPTYNYTSTSLNGIDATTGSFSSEGQKEGLHTIQLQYTDANGCNGSASAQVTVYARPIVEFDLPSAICDYASAVNLTGTVKYEDGGFAPITAGTASFTGTGGVADSKFTPTGLLGSKDVTLAYTDIHDCKAVNVSHSIVVNHTDAPTPISNSDSKLNVVNQATVPLLSADGADDATYKWYLENDTTTTVEAQTQTYQIGFVPDTDGKMKEGQYSAYVTQTMNGCQSVPAQAILTITDCPVTSPTAPKYFACVGQNGIDVTAVSTYANPESDDSKTIGWFWDNTKIPVTTVASLAAAQPDGTGATFSISSDKLNDAGNVTIYVAEYDATSGKECFSPAIPVTVEVHAKPQPTITVPDVICSTEQQIDVTYGPASSADGKVISTLTAEHGTISDNKWTLYFDESATGITETDLTVKTDEIWGLGTPQEQTCSTTISETFSVTHVNAPTGTGIGTPQIWSSSAEKLTLIPDMVINYANDLNAVLSVVNSQMSEIGTSSPIDMKPNITAEGSYEYQVTQWVNGCQSPTVTSVWNIVDCPTPAPTAESVVLCAKDNTLAQNSLPTLHAENVGNQTDSWIWYSDAEGTQKVGEGQNLTLQGLESYTSEITEETVYTFYVKQNGNDGTGGNDMCYGPLSQPITVTIHPNPIVAISDLPVLCYYDVTKTAKATVNGNDLATLTSGNGEWKFFEGAAENAAGIAATGEINLQVNGETDGEYIIQYEYTDENNCYGKETKAIEIEFAETPATEEVKRLTIDESDVEVLAGGIADKTGTEVNWYAGADDPIVLSHNNPWLTGDDKTTEKKISYYVSQTIRGCESKREEQIISIILCPFEAPAVANVRTCQNVTFDAIEASTSEMVDEWLWYEKDGDALKSIVNNSGSFAPTVDNSVVATTTYYVSYLATESKTGKQCESKKSEVTATVLPLPEIQFNGNSSLLCYDLGAHQMNTQVDYHQNGAGSGVWSVDGETGMISPSGEFITNSKSVENELASQKPTYVVRYTYTDGMECQNTNTFDVQVRYAAKPLLSHHYTMTSQNIDAELQATLDAGDTVRWYNTLDDVRVLSGANPWKTGDKGTIEVDRTYFASQVVDGCESQRAETTVKIVPCPIPAPTTIGNEMCNYDAVPELTAEVSAWTERPNGQAEMFYLYNANNEKIDENSTGVFVSSVDTSVAKVHTFYISEYNSQPIAGLTIQAGCESPKASVQLTVKKTAQATISATQDKVCEYPEGTNPVMSAMGYVGNGEYNWYEEDPNYPNCQPSSETGLKYTPFASEVGSHSVWLVVKDEDCYSVPTKKEFTIKQIPARPEVTANEVCEDDANVALSAVSENGYIMWYSNENRANSSLLKSNSTTFIPTVTDAGDYTFYATQTVDGCQSPVSEVAYRIKARPKAPKIITNEYHYCEYDTPPALQAQADPEGASIRWYLSDKKTYANADNEQGFGEIYQLESLTQGKNMLYASQVYEGCEGAQSLLVFYVYAKPSTPVVTNAAMCEGSNAIPTLSTNLLSDKWYADSLATSSPFNVGYTYTPDSSEVKDKDLVYYIIREQNQCFSDTVPVTLRVIKTPTIYLGEDTAFCIYDTLPSIVAEVTPAFEEGSSFSWFISPNALGKSVSALDTFNIEEYKNTITKKTIDYTIRAQYLVKISDILTCKSAFDTVHYVVNERGRKPVVFSKVICEGEEIVPLRALGSPNIEWRSLDGILPEEWHGQKFEFSRGQTIPTGMYRFMVSDEDMYTGCKSEYDTLEMTVAPAAKTKIIGQDSTCMKNTISYYSQYSEGSTYYWDVTSDVLNYSKENMSSSVRYFDFNEAGMDTITLYERTWAGCEGFDTLVVAVGPMPKAGFSWSLPGESNIIELVDSTVQDTIWKLDDNGELVGEPIPYQMMWNLGHGNDDEIDTVIAYERRRFPILEGDYIYGYNCPSLTVENSFGCRDKYTECIFVNIATSIYVPSAFAPTNPAHAVRTFQPKGFNLKTCEISVYDKWGNLLWFSNEVRDGMFVGYWDGRYDGKMMQAGDYIWKMEATFIDGQVWDGYDSGNGKKTKYGNVMLLR